MKKLIPALISVMFSSSVWSQQSLPEAPKKMYNYIYANHLFQHEDEKFIGGWETKVYFKQSLNLLSLNENSFFVPIFIMQTLDDVNKKWELPRFDRLKQSFQGYVEGFLDDNDINGGPRGTINYWRSYPVPGNSSIQHYYPKDPQSFNVVESAVLNLRNIPNDIDGSAQLCDWLIRVKAPQAQDYCADLVELLSDDTYVDIKGRKQSVFDDKWKHPGSGAFLTWASTSPKRIPYNANDVDCVVNLNILNSFNSILQEYGETAITPIKRHIPQVCGMLQNVIKRNQGSVCSPYYDDTTFYWTVSKNYQNALLQDCFRPVENQIKARIFALAKSYASQIKYGFFSAQPTLPKSINTVDVAEVLVSLANFDMLKDPLYGNEVRSIYRDLLTALMTKSQRKAAQLAIDEGFAFRGIIHLNKEEGTFKLTGLWKSSYLATVLTLEAYLKSLSN